MKLHYKGKFDGNSDSLPSGELEKQNSYWYMPEKN